MQGGSIKKAYAGFVKHFREELGYTVEKATALWNKRKADPSWPRGNHAEDGQLTLAVLKDQETLDMEDIGHQAAVEGQSKDKRNVEPDQLQKMISGLRQGPPGEQFSEELFDSMSSAKLGVASASHILTGPRAEDFNEEARSAKHFMLSEGLLEPEPGAPDAAEQPGGVDSASGHDDGSPKKPFDANIAKADLKFNAVNAVAMMEHDFQSLRPVLEKINDEVGKLVGDQPSLNDSKKLAERGLQWIRAVLGQNGTGPSLQQLVTDAGAKKIEAPVLMLAALKTTSSLRADAQTLGDGASLDKDNIDAAKMKWDETFSTHKALLTAVQGYKTLIARQMGVVERRQDASNKKQALEVKKKAQAAEQKKAAQEGGNVGKAVGDTKNVKNSIFACDLSAHMQIASVDVKALGDETFDPGRPYIVKQANEKVQAFTANAAHKISLLCFRAKSNSTDSWKQSGIANEEIQNAADMKQDLQAFGPSARNQEFRIAVDGITEKVHWTVARLPKTCCHS